MDKILSIYLILIIYLVLAACWDAFFLGIPMWMSYFAFFGWLIFTERNRLFCLAAASMAALSVYFISEIISRIRKMAVLGRGDIYIIFIIGLFLDVEMYISAIFLTCVFALVMAAVFCLFMKYGEFPLAPAFLFGTVAALW